MLTQIGALPAFFSHSALTNVRTSGIGAHVGLTPRRHQSGEIDFDGGISKFSDTMLRTMLYEAAQVLLTQSRHWSWLKAWGMKVAQRLAVVLHRTPTRARARLA